jgi:hypothetical protein
VYQQKSQYAIEQPIVTSIILGMLEKALAKWGFVAYACSIMKFCEGGGEQLPLQLSTEVAWKICNLYARNIALSVSLRPLSRSPRKFASQSATALCIRLLGSHSCRNQTRNEETTHICRPTMYNGVSGCFVQQRAHSSTAHRTDGIYMWA